MVSPAMKWWLFLLLLAMIYGVSVGIPLFGEDIDNIEMHFGDTAFGYPIRYVFSAAMALYVTPFAFGAWHFLNIVEQMAADGEQVTGKVGLVTKVFAFREKHPEQATSWWIVMACVFWFLIGLLALQYFVPPKP